MHTSSDGLNRNVRGDPVYPTGSASAGLKAAAATAASAAPPSALQIILIVVPPMALKCPRRRAARAPDHPPGGRVSNGKRRATPSGRTRRLLSPLGEGCEGPGA